MFYGEDETTDEYYYESPHREEDHRYWTPYRIVLTMITLILLLAFIAYMLLPVIQGLQQPSPPPLPIMPSV